MPSRVWQHKTFLRTTSCPFSWFCHAIPLLPYFPSDPGLQCIRDSAILSIRQWMDHHRYVLINLQTQLWSIICISFVLSWPIKTCQYAGTCSTLLDGVRLDVAAFRGLCSISAYQWPHNPVVIVTQVCRPKWPIVTGNYYALAIFIRQIPWSTDVSLLSQKGRGVQLCYDLKV